MKKCVDIDNIVRVAATSPVVHIGNVSANVKEIEHIYSEYEGKADLIVTPELSLTGYTCQDLFANRYLIDSARDGLLELAAFTQGKEAVLIVGLPLEWEGAIWNCAAVIQGGNVEGIIPKIYLPNYGEFYEKRWFSANEVLDEVVCLDKEESYVPFGTDLIFTMRSLGVTFGVEICEDAWAPVSPGRLMALNGAELIINLSASNEVIGKESYRRNLISGVSASCICAYVYASAGMYESTSDVVFSGHKMVYSSGKLLGEKKPFEEGDLLCDISFTKIKHDRIANKTFSECKKTLGERRYRDVILYNEPVKKEHLLYKVPMTPFVPSKDARNRCLSIFAMQVAGLQRRLIATKSKHIVIGISGGLDSTLALLVSAKAVRNLGLPSTTVIGITMPGFGTTNRTKNNSIALMEKLGCEIRTVSIVDSVRQHFKDIGHEEEIHDITYENCQARERTQILMDVANKEGGFVIGTGDLSELVLGWCTYNGDHMSMYGVNNSIPKTLVRTLVDEIGHELEETGFTGIAPIIEDIIDTPVSPELLPPNPDGTIAQKTEDTIGSYIIHDFLIYYTLRYGMAPKEVFELCKEAVWQSDVYKFSEEDILKCMETFYRRFFTQQFKRNCMPDGVKVGTVSVSPRGDLRMPSEVEFHAWVEEVKGLKERIY